MTLTLLDLAGHFSFALSALSFALRDMLLLRGLAIASGIVGIGYNYFIPAGPLWLVIFWLAVFVAINAARIVGIYAERRAVAFSDEEAELHETLFRDFSAVEFMKLMRVGDWRSATEGHTFAKQGGDIEGLKLLYNGEVAVARDGAEIARVRDGALIGEMSFLRGGAATATVTATRPCRYVYWPKDALRKLLARNPSMDIAMKHVLSIDLTRKLAGPEAG